MTNPKVSIIVLNWNDKEDTPSRPQTHAAHPCTQPQACAQPVHPTTDDRGQATFRLVDRRCGGEGVQAVGHEASFSGWGF